MSSVVHRTKAALLVVAIAATIVFPLSLSAGARAKDPRAKGLSLDDAAHYLDVTHTLPPSFRQLTVEEGAPDGANSGEMATIVYESDESGSGVVLHMTVGKGRLARAFMQELLEIPETLYTTDDLMTLFADQGAPVDEISVTPGEWTDVDVGDRGVASVYTIEVQGERVHFQVLVMLVSRGKDTALVEIDHIFGPVPTVDVAELAGPIATKIRSGPPSPERKIATAGLITLSELPTGWEPAAIPSTITAGTGAADTDGDVPDSEGDTAAVARGIPACRTLAALLTPVTGAGGATGSNASGSVQLSLDGERFRHESARATSIVEIYPTRVGANGFFELVRDPSVRACLDKLYRKVATVSVQAGGDSLPEAQREALRRVKVTVTTPQSPSVGDEHVLYRVTVDLNPLRDVRFVVEQEFVRAGRAVGVYTFSGLEGTTVRDQVLPIVVGRLAAAQ